MGLLGWLVIRPSDMHSSGGTESVPYRVTLSDRDRVRVEVWIRVVLKDPCDPPLRGTL